MNTLCFNFLNGYGQFYTVYDDFIQMYEGHVHIYYYDVEHTVVDQEIKYFTGHNESYVQDEIEKYLDKNLKGFCYR